ncbi:hypothetical protein NDA16_000538 [Ustilago loliicola]|nr:hypothetical protein NDA16_000538 [Ustilago loliicola]
MNSEPPSYGIQHADLDDYPIICEEPIPSDASSDDELDEDLDAMDEALDPGYYADPFSNTRRQRLSKNSLAAPVRAMSAAQLAQLHEQYVAQDVPHSVVFPFLHGVDGSIPAQNAFFGAPRTGQPTPPYRGLTILRADMPTPQEMERMQASTNAYSSTRARARTFSSVTTQSSGSSPDTDDESARFEPSWNGPTSPPASNFPNTSFTPGSTASISPSTASTVSSQMSRPSLFSVTSESCSTGSRTSVSTVSDIADDGMRTCAKDLRPASPVPFEAQPRHSVLNSTIFPAEILRPPKLSRVMYGRNVCSDLSESGSFGEQFDAKQVRRVGASFVNPPQASGVSLRNFKIQSAKYATISDIVIYCPFGYHAGVMTLAKWVREAQASLRRERLLRGWGGLQYNVFVVTDSFSAFEQRFPSLVSLDSNGFERNRVDFVEREREEMERMTRATEIHDNVWVGCTADAPGLLKRDGSSDDSEPTTPDEQANPNRFAVCISCEEAGSHGSRSFDYEEWNKAGRYLEVMDARVRMLRSFRNDALLTLGLGHDGFRDSDSRDGSIVLGPNGWTPKCRSVPVHTDVHTETVKARLGADDHATDPSERGPLYLEASRVVHLQIETSGAFDNQKLQTVKEIVDACMWIHSHASGSDTSRPRRVLLHCNDGYTETSVLALAYLMYARELSLPEAYLDLQLRADRSFFVYESDVVILETIDREFQQRRALASCQAAQKRQDASADARRSRHAASKSLGGSLSGDKRSAELRRMSLSVAASHNSARPVGNGLVYSAESGKRSTLATHSPAEMGGGICRTSTPTPQKCRPNQADMIDTVEAVDKHAWFDRSRFDGSFPSRILPFLYLGNLSHASNVGMLRELGITHLVSVGETALAPPASISAKVNPTRKDQGRSRYQKASTKAALAEDPLTVPSCTYQTQGINVLNVRNVSDDGIDSLRGTMREAVQFIEAARLSGGRVLVHCRVGVSRSTTIVLAYVMAHLDLGLVESYLLVRSRRLNIVIQPHLLFLWELRGFETYLYKAKQAQINLLRGRHGSPDLVRSELPKEASQALSALSIRNTGAPRSEEGSGSYKSAWSSPSGSPAAISTMPVPSTVEIAPSSAAWSEEHLLGVEIGAGAGSVHGFDMAHSAMLPFGSGSPNGLPYSATRLTWGHLAREIADLNSRYFI